MATAIKSHCQFSIATLSLLGWCVLTMGLDPPVGGLHEVLAGGGASFEVALIVRSRARVLAKVTLGSSGVFTMVLSLELETKVYTKVPFVIIEKAV